MLFFIAKRTLNIDYRLLLDNIPTKSNRKDENEPATFFI